MATAGRGGVRGNELEDLAGGVRPAVPDRIAIPAARVDTVVDAVGTGRGGAIRVPSLGRAGWYDGGPRPGEPGRAVIIGHLDTKRGPGLFARVPSLRTGEDIRITDRRGRVHDYLVVGRAQVRKDRFPTAGGLRRLRAAGAGAGHLRRALRPGDGLPGQHPGVRQAA